MTATTNNRFPSPAGGHSFGNDDKQKAKASVIPECFCRGSVVITNRVSLIDNNGFPTTTFGNDDKQKSKKQKKSSSPNILAIHRA